ncbi:MAG TPA: hypothetical protein VE645_07480 [Pseudonocardiaceae bacterium]|nr:hypothetical protein [Pseudonocardiaceae bacterium]
MGGPDRGRVSSDHEEMDLSGAHAHDEQNVETAQPGGVEGEEVGGEQPGGLSAQEGPSPGVGTPWRRAQPCGGQNPPDRAHAHAVSEPGQFSLETSVSQDKFSCARRSTRARISSSIGGRPDRFG